MKNICFLLTVMSVILTPPLRAEPVKNPLHLEIQAMDTALFDAVNTQNLDKLKTMFTKDLEFYHDQGGVTNYEQNLEASRKNFANGRKMRRDLISGSMRVYPVPNFGAIQTGEHRFCDLGKGEDDCGVYKFVHVWKRTPDGLKLARVVSFDH